MGHPNGEPPSISFAERVTAPPESVRASNSLSVGDRVYIADDVVPQNLGGLAGTITAVHGHRVYVALPPGETVVDRRFIRIVHRPYVGSFLFA